MGYLQAVESFRTANTVDKKGAVTERGRIIKEGAVFADDDPIVKGRESLFEPLAAGKPEPVRRAKP